MERKLIILGVTGSIGQQTLLIAKQLGYKVVGCSYHTNHELAKQLIDKYSIPYYLCTSNTSKSNCKNYQDLINKVKPDLIVNAIIGFPGFEATVVVIKNKINLALANKESMVVGGAYITKLAKKNNVNIIPIDSEHTNLYEQLINTNQKEVNQLYITGSGGKYFNFNQKQKANVNWQEATTHKNWKMGEKITIDSNTLVNKCFEVIEAFWYFKTKKINVLLDNTSIIHSALLLNDGSFIFSHSKPLMTDAIAKAISNFTYQTPPSLKQEPINNVLIKINDVEPISWAYQVFNDKTNSLGVIINAANEVAIDLFKKKVIKFSQIIPFISNCLKKINLVTLSNDKDIINFDKKVRKLSLEIWKQ